MIERVPARLCPAARPVRLALVWSAVAYVFSALTGCAGILSLDDYHGPVATDGGHDAEGGGSPMKDAREDVDATCKVNGAICSSASECCGLGCEDDNGTLRCQ